MSGAANGLHFSGAVKTINSYTRIISEIFTYFKSIHSGLKCLTMILLHSQLIYQISLIIFVYNSYNACASTGVSKIN